MMSAFVTEAIGESISLPVKPLLRTTCDQAGRAAGAPVPATSDTTWSLKGIRHNGRESEVC
jgi:hypothetical protein